MSDGRTDLPSDQRMIAAPTSRHDKVDPSRSDTELPRVFKLPPSALSNRVRHDRIVLLERQAREAASSHGGRSVFNRRRSGTGHRTVRSDIRCHKVPLINQTHNACGFRHTITRCVDRGNSSNRPSASRVPQASRCRCRTGCSPRPARRQNRASVLAGWLLATGPMQKSQTKPSCFRIHEAPAFSPTSPKAARCPTQAATQVWQASWALSRGSTRRTPPAGTEVAGTGRTIPRTRALRRKSGRPDLGCAE